MKWISVKENVPEENVKVLVCTEHGSVLTAHYSRGWWHVAFGLKVTHWMPLPELPKEEE